MYCTCTAEDRFLQTIDKSKFSPEVYPRAGQRLKISIAWTIRCLTVQFPFIKSCGTDNRESFLLNRESDL